MNRVEIDPHTEIRLLRSKCLRLVTENDGGEADVGDDGSDEGEERYNIYPPEKNSIMIALLILCSRILRFHLL